MAGRWVGCGLVARPYFENFTVDASIFVVSKQATKCNRWMPRHQEPMKDVGTCDKPRGVGNQTVIRGFPNRETYENLILMFEHKLIRTLREVKHFST